MIGKRDEVTFASVAGGAPRSGLAKAASAAAGSAFILLGAMAVAACSGSGLLVAGVGVAILAGLVGDMR